MGLRTLDLQGGKTREHNELVVNVTADWKLRAGHNIMDSLLSSSLLPDGVHQDIYKKLFNQLFHPSSFTIIPAETIANQGVMLWSSLLAGIPREVCSPCILDVDDELAFEDYRQLASTCTDLTIIGGQPTLILRQAGKIDNINVIVLKGNGVPAGNYDDIENPGNHPSIDFRKMRELLYQFDTRKTGLYFFSESEFLNSELLRIPNFIHTLRANIVPILTCDNFIQNAFVWCRRSEGNYNPEPIYLSSPSFEMSISGGSSSVITMSYKLPWD